MGLLIHRWNGDRTVAASILSAGFSDYPIPQAETPQDIERQVAAGFIDANVSLVSTVDGAPVAGAFAALRRDGLARLHSMAVHPAHRRHGIARKLLAELVRLLEHQSARAIHLEVLTRNSAARTLYESFGFTATRRMVSFDRHHEGSEHTNDVIVSGTSRPPAPTFRSRPLHRDMLARSVRKDVSVAHISEPADAWIAFAASARGDGAVLLDADGSDLERHLPALLATMPPGRNKIVDVPVGDRLEGLLRGAGWRKYAEQWEMVRSLETRTTEAQSD